jgi:SAM-dependent methyltransferase
MRTVLALAIAASTQAQVREVPNVPYVPTPPEVVREMIKLAKVASGDVVYDLGCGDGRIVIRAAQIPGVRGVCVEIDPEQIAESRRNAEEAGVADRIRFVQGDLFNVAFDNATVVMLYLLPDYNLRLRPRLLRELRPGARIVSHAFDMGDWQPDQRVVVELTPLMQNTIYLWIVPGR